MAESMQPSDVSNPFQNMGPNPNTDPNFTAQDQNTAHARMDKTINDYGNLVKKMIARDSPANSTAERLGEGDQEEPGLMQGPEV